MKQESQGITLRVSTSGSRTSANITGAAYILFSMLVLSVAALAYEPPPGSEYRVYPSNFTQTETFITRHPTNPDILFASANTINLATAFISEGIYVTTNFGRSWFGSDTCYGSPISFHRGDPGIAIDKDGRFILIRLGFSPGLYSHYSTNFGVTWSSQRTVATNDQDRATLTSDDNPASTYYGRTYATWVKFAPPYPVLFSYTDNGGGTWSTPVQINNPSQRGQGGEIATGPGGRVYITWAGVISTSPFTEDFAGVAASADGGTTWSVTENAFDMNGIAGIFSQKANIRVNGLPRIDVDRSGGARDGWIYVATTQRGLSPAGSDPDIIVNRSTDSGTSWSAGIRVNQDPVNNGKYQYFPAIHVDDHGGVNVLYYDDRGTTTDSATVYLSRSIDGGFSWQDFRVAGHNFKPQAIGGLGQGYQGDNIGLTSSRDTLWPVWMDNSTGIYQLWTKPIGLEELVGVKSDGQRSPRSLQLKQNYPNPFNPGTTIEYQVTQPAAVTLIVYDIHGREVTVLVRNEQQPGSYSVRLDANNLLLASGVYLYRLRVGHYSVTRKMLLLR